MASKRLRRIERVIKLIYDNCVLSENILDGLSKLYQTDAHKIAFGMGLLPDPGKVVEVDFELFSEFQLPYEKETSKH